MQMRFNKLREKHIKKIDKTNILNSNNKLNIKTLKMPVRIYGKFFIFLCLKNTNHIYKVL